MDNEPHALENQEICETCKHWKQFNATTGFCNAPNNWHDETFYDQKCDSWQIKS